MNLPFPCSPPQALVGEDRALLDFMPTGRVFFKCLRAKPGEEPDEKQMKKLIRLCSDEQHPIRIIAVEPQYSTSTSGATLKKELINKGVKDPVLVEIDPLETVRPDELTPDWYEKKMRANVKALADAMK